LNLIFSQASTLANERYVTDLKQRYDGIPSSPRATIHYLGHIIFNHVSLYTGLERRLESDRQVSAQQSILQQKYDELEKLCQERLEAHTSAQSAHDTLIAEYQRKLSIAQTSAAARVSELESLLESSRADVDRLAKQCQMDQASLHDAHGLAAGQLQEAAQQNQRLQSSKNELDSAFRRMEAESTLQLAQMEERLREAQHNLYRVEEDRALLQARLQDSQHRLSSYSVDADIDNVPSDQHTDNIPVRQLSKAQAYDQLEKKASIISTLTKEASMLQEKVREHLAAQQDSQALAVKFGDDLAVMTKTLVALQNDFQQQSASIAVANTQNKSLSEMLTTSERMVNDLKRELATLRETTLAASLLHETQLTTLREQNVALETEVRHDSDAVIILP
jgi:hypothetical protein